jgi:type IV pilus biogenesis protein CpaD/CtpE
MMQSLSRRFALRGAIASSAVATILPPAAAAGNVPAVVEPSNPIVALVAERNRVKALLLASDARCT